MIAIAITASTNEGEQPDTPNFILIEMTFPPDTAGGPPTKIQSPSDSSVAIQTLYRSVGSTARETELLFLIVPAEQGDWQFTFPADASSTIWTRNSEEVKSSSVSREVTVK